jgi:hypothetical protein
VTQANYRVSPGAWIVLGLYGRITPTTHVAYWLGAGGRVSLTPGGPPLTKY